MKNIKSFNELEKLDESIVSKIKNNKYIRKIKKLLKDGTDEEMISYLESIIDETSGPIGAAKFDLLRNEIKEGTYRSKGDPQNLLRQLLKLLEDGYLIDNIRIQGPNSQLNGWLVNISGYPKK